MQIDITHARTLTDMSAFLQYLVSIYGAELYKDKQRLYNLIADLYTGEERLKKLFRRAILEDNMAQRVYELKNKTLGERKTLTDAIAYRFSENNYYTNEIGKKVTFAFVEGLNLSLDIILKQRKDGRWEDGQGNIYSEDRLTFESANWKVSEVFIKDGVTSIGREAFKHCESLSSIAIPNSVTSIGSCAFMGCTSLPSVVIPDSVTKIEWLTFAFCTALTAITIPKGVTEIDGSAFIHCTSLVKINVAEENANFISIDGVLYSKDISKLLACPGKKDSLTIPDCITSIEDSAFTGCTSLSSIVIPNSVTSIGRFAFDGCTSLFSIVIPDSITSIGSWAFRGCTSLSSIVIPDSVTSIEGAVFSDCTSLSSIVIPDSVMYIGGKAFYNCTSLSSIKIPDSVRSIGNGAFGGCFSLEKFDITENNVNFMSIDGALYNKDMSKLLACSENKTDFIIPDSVTSIGASAFEGCTSLFSVVIPNSVMLIGDSAFKDCKSLSSILIPNSVTSIGDSAFYGCTSLSFIEVPCRIRSISSGAFMRCTFLSSIVIPDVTSIEASAFYGCDSLKTIIASRRTFERFRTRFPKDVQLQEL